MSRSLRKPGTLRLAPAGLLLFSSLCCAQADVDVGGSEADDGGYDQPYPDQGRYGPNAGYGGSDSYGYGADSGMPIVYAGDGMRVSIEQVDDAGVYARGTLSINNQQPMQFELQMEMGPYGNLSMGQVMTPNGPKPIRATDEAEEVTVAEFEGRRYRLVYQEPGNNRGYERPNEGQRPAAPPANFPPDGNSGNMPPNPNETRRDSPPPAPQPVANPASPRTVEFVKQKLGNTHTLLVPKGWKVEGGAWSPPPKATAWMPSQMITVTAPDGSGVRFKPNVSAMDQRINAVPRAQPGSLNASGLINLPVPENDSQWAQYVENDSIRSVYQDASNIRMGTVRVVPELTEKLRRLYAPQAQLMASFNAADFAIRSDQKSMSIESSYSTGGKRWQQIDAFNHLISIGQVASAWGGSDTHIGWDMRDAVSVRAPEGTLDTQMPVLLAIINSLRPTPEYTRHVAELHARSSKASHEATMDTINTYMTISQSTYNANKSVNDSIMEGYRTRNESQNRGQRDFVNYIHDQQDYSDPSAGGNVTLPSSYDRVFSNGRGEYVLTNDAAFEPGADWNAINRARN